MNFAAGFTVSRQTPCHAAAWHHHLASAQVGPPGATQLTVIVLHLTVPAPLAVLALEAPAAALVLGEIAQVSAVHAAHRHAQAAVGAAEHVPGLWPRAGCTLRLGMES
eukprot:CAMPEP_0202869682 /NCGR_PEP_ID=MMETSP1391-20130828/12586_1 /ASSEMBLY_ACC=CAM_ASM_000867 /TAXON_ID=1034604 /ORGANISM="Chlamydomonas leiostraca, Strain SAG 11-49" /LENGTH=107 /DNA_ID=CAMNT_0049550023 /DNA_START=288 /DNA_END=612 /DNA_ORIENTATION=+